jgi:hypothetical protein
MKTIPGGTLKSIEMLTQLLWRVIDEITSDTVFHTAISDQVMNSPAFIEVHREDTDATVEGRRVNCLTAVFPVMLTQNNIADDSLHEGFVFVPCDKFGDPTIVDHHRATLQAIYALAQKR